jgi:hypothetical protein
VSFAAHLKNIRFRNTLAALVLSALALSGCGKFDSMQANERASKLRDAVRTYGKLVRWGEFAAASRYIRVPEKSDVEAPKQSLSMLKSVRVTHYRLTHVEFNEDQQKATVSHELRFFHNDTRREVSTVDRQQWWLDEKSSGWFLNGNVPDFTGALRAPK